MGSRFTPKHKRLIFEICILGRFSKDSVNFEASSNMFIHLFIYLSVFEAGRFKSEMHRGVRFICWLESCVLRTRFR